MELKVHYRSYNSPPLLSVVNQINLATLYVPFAWLYASAAKLIITEPF